MHRGFTTTGVDVQVSQHLSGYICIDRVTKRNNIDEGTDSAGPDTARNSSLEHFSWERFFQLDKDVAVIKIRPDRRVHEVRSDLKDLKKGMDRKFDKINRRFERTDGKTTRLIYFFLGGIVLKGEFDFYMKEAQKDRIAGENCVTK